MVGGAIFSTLRNTDVISWHPLIFSGAQGVAHHRVRRRTRGSPTPAQVEGGQRAVSLTCQVPKVALAEHQPAARRCAGHHQGTRDRPSRKRAHQRGRLRHLPLRCRDTRVRPVKGRAGRPRTTGWDRLALGWNRACAGPASSAHITTPKSLPGHDLKLYQGKAPDVKGTPLLPKVFHSDSAYKFTMAPPLDLTLSLPRHHLQHTQPRPQSSPAHRAAPGTIALSARSRPQHSCSPDSDSTLRVATITRRRRP